MSTCPLHLVTVDLSKSCLSERKRKEGRLEEKMIILRILEEIEERNKVR